LENKKAPIEGVCALLYQRKFCPTAHLLRQMGYQELISNYWTTCPTLLVGQQVFTSESKPRLTHRPKQKQNKRPETIWVSLRKQTLKRSNKWNVEWFMMMHFDHRASGLQWPKTRKAIGSWLIELVDSSSKSHVLLPLAFLAKPLAYFYFIFRMPTFPHPGQLPTHSQQLSHLQTTLGKHIIALHGGKQCLRQKPSLGAIT
jgi:hypothetical protein